jgi:2-polyprenyl-3-methyl-5-hydroxy-6-metoxy-1,4-benzoquinol methylase
VTRIALLLFDSLDPTALQRTLDRVPDGVEERIEEIVVVLDGPDPKDVERFEALRTRHGALVLHRTPRNSGSGGARKSAFEYALARGFDRVVVMRGDGSHPPELLEQLLAAVREREAPLVVAARSGSVSGSGSWLARAVRPLVSGVPNRILGLRLRDYASGFRVYSVESLRLIPFQLNSNDDAFDMELLIQYRALGAPSREVVVAPSWEEHAGIGDAIARFLRRCRSALGYRLHQLHATRRGRYFVDEGIHYTLKLSPTASHMQIVETLSPESFVLDLGCSQGLLARPLQDRGVRVVGVDTGSGEQLVAELEQYFQRDLEEPLEIPFGRVFDAVVVSDVIEHVIQRPVLLRSVRRYLKEGGRLIISTPNVALWFYRLSLLVGRFEYGPRGVLDETHVHLFTRATFRREVEGAGFRIVGERVTALPFEVVLRSTGRSRLVRTLAGAYHVAARVWPEMFAYQFILEAEIATLDEDATFR